MKKLPVLDSKVATLVADYANSAEGLGFTPDQAALYEFSIRNAGASPTEQIKKIIAENAEDLMSLYLTLNDGNAFK